LVLAHITLQGGDSIFFLRLGPEMG